MIITIKEDALIENPELLRKLIDTKIPFKITFTKLNQNSN